MLKFKTTNRFDKDLKKLLKQGKSKDKIYHVMETIIDQTILAPKYREHKLHGEWKDCTECHIEPDWILIYRLEADFVSFERTGSHSDLFG